MTTALVATERTYFPTEGEITETLRLAKALVESEFLPKGVNTPAKAVALMLTGREMGLGPMAALRSISIVDGRPVIAADRQLGMFKRAGGRAEFVTLTETKAELHLTHPNGDTHVEEFTLDDAHRAGLTGKDNWKRYPKAMLRSRCITAGLKSIGFEPLADVYDPDEVTPAPEPPPTSPEPAPAPSKGMDALRKKLPAPTVAEPAPEPPPPAPVDDALSGRLAALDALLRDQSLPGKVRIRILTQREQATAPTAEQVEAWTAELEASRPPAKHDGKAAAAGNGPDWGLDQPPTED